MINLSVLVYVKIAYVVVMLTYFSILDIKYRDIPDKQVWFSLGIAVLLFILSIPGYLELYNIRFFLSYLLMTIVIGPLILYILYYKDLIGDADVVIASEIAILFPVVKIYDYVYMKTSVVIHLPPIIPILLYTNLLVLVLLPIIIVKNIVLHRNIYRGVETGFFKKIVLLATSKPVKVCDYLKMKHVFPLEEFIIDKDGVKRRFRTTFSIQEDYRDHQERLKELIRKGVIDKDTVMIVTYGIPYLVPMLLGFILFLLIGDLLFIPLLS